jgi:DNA-binding HxlR family transcriptional regulator
MNMSTDAETFTWRSVCPIASGLDILGDRWSLIIVRDLIVHGTRTYSEFSESAEGISTNILAARLKLLSAIGLIAHVNPDGGTRNNAYQLTPSGVALRPVLEELGRWSQTYLKSWHPDIVSIE